MSYNIYEKQIKVGEKFCTETKIYIYRLYIYYI